MKLVLSVFVFFSAFNTSAQCPYLFRERGALLKSRVVADTTFLIDELTDTMMLFEKIDVFLKKRPVNANIRSFLSKYSAENSFIIYNGSQTVIALNVVNGLVVAMEAAKDSSGTYEPVSSFSYASCASGIQYGGRGIKPKYALVLLNKFPPLQGEFVTTATMSLKPMSGNTLRSEPYTIRISYDAFYMPAEDEKFFPIMIDRFEKFE